MQLVPSPNRYVLYGLVGHSGINIHASIVPMSAINGLTNTWCNDYCETELFCELRMFG